MQNAVSSNERAADNLGFHGSKCSTTWHNELLVLIDSAGTYDDFVAASGAWANNRLLGGRSPSARTSSVNDLIIWQQNTKPLMCGIGVFPTLERLENYLREEIDPDDNVAPISSSPKPWTRRFMTMTSLSTSFTGLLCP